MSDNWVGPGWWMASDGKWYPPRTPAVDLHAPDGQPTRWSRRTPDGEPIAGATALTDAESRAEDVATRRERAARMPRPEPVSIKRVEEEDSMPVELAPSDSDEDVDVEIEEVQATAGTIDLTLLDQPADTTQDVDEDQSVEVDLRESIDLREAATLSTVDVSSLAMSATTPGVTDPSNDAGSDATAAAPTSESATTPRTPPSSSTVGANGSISAPSTAEHTEVSTPANPPLQHAVLPAVAEPEPEPRRGKGLILLALATLLAVLSGLLGALWLRERSDAADLREELARVQAADEVSSAGLAELNDEVRTLRLQNEQLETRLDEMSALALELPEGRVTEIAVPFTPVFADEENNRFIAVSETGDYVVWSEGADGPITDSGVLSGGPTGVFAATAKAWIATDAGTIEIVSLTNAEGNPTVEFGPVSFMAAEERAYWTYDTTTGDVVRLRKGDGSITASASVPVPVVDLTIGAGSVWALGDDGLVYRINTADFTVQEIDAGEDLISITAGPDALWTLSAADGSLRRVDPVSGEVLVTVPVGRDPIDATFAGSSVWVALRAGTSLIEVDTRTAAVVSRTSLPGTPTALHQGDTGVFVTLEGEVPLVRVASLIQPPAEDVEELDDPDAAN